VGKGVRVIPYVHVAPVTLGPVSVDPDDLLNIVGLALGFLFLHRRARWLGIEERRVNSFLAWLLIGAVIGGHLVDVFCFRFGAVAEISAGRVYWRDPWELLRFWHGGRSVGGCSGAIIATFLWSRYLFCWSPWFRLSRSTQVEGYRFVRRQRPEPVIGLADAALFVFPLFWALSRAGSALVHEHPGRRAPGDAWLAVAYPATTLSDGFAVVRGAVPRYDLGLLEFLATLPFVLGMVLWWKRPYRAGTAVYLAGLIYPPARFGLDFLARRSGELAEPRLAGLTPTQWGFGAIWIAALLALMRAPRSALLAEAHRGVQAPAAHRR
jgi:prolipoprotein diacylglyceryltransferase